MCCSTLINYTGNPQKFSLQSAYDKRAPFLDVSKGFEKVWYKSLIPKFKCYYADDSILQLMENYFNRLFEIVRLLRGKEYWLGFLRVLRLDNVCF